MQSIHVEALSMSAAEELAASVAHAVNNPLAALMGTIELERKRSKNSAFLDRILVLTRRINHVITQPLTLYRRGRPELSEAEPVGLTRRVISELYAMSAERFVITDLKAPSDIPKVRADPILLATALGSLLENAIQFSTAGSNISLTIEPESNDRVTHFTVSDSGPGIPQEMREQMFEPFFSTRVRGLGLAIVKAVVRGHSGRVRIEASPGGGTSVILELPSGESS